MHNIIWPVWVPIPGPMRFLVQAKAPDRRDQYIVVLCTPVFFDICGAGRWDETLQVWVVEAEVTRAHAYHLDREGDKLTFSVCFNSTYDLGPAHRYDISYSRVSSGLKYEKMQVKIQNQQTIQVRNLHL